ncbi:MAG: outer membrane protein transport protein [Acetobacteraceae bacterium]
MHNRLLRYGLATCFTLGITFSARTAAAAAFQLREDSAVGLGTAFAGTGSAANTPATVFDNPAGMTQLPGLQIMLVGSLIAPSYVFHGSASNALGRSITGRDGVDGGNLGLVPYGYVTYKATPDLALGLGITSPFGLATTYPSNFVGRYQADKTDLKTININPSIAYQLLPWLSVGAGVSAQYGRAEFSSFVNASSVAASVLGRAVALPDGYFRLRGDNWAFGYNLGVLVQPGPGTNIGLSYRSRVQQDFSGMADYIMPAPLNLSSRFRSSRGTAKLVLPDTATVSLTQALSPQLTVSADVTWTNWSQFKQLSALRDDGTLLASTPQHYDNSYFVSLGAAYRLNERLTLRAGTAYDKSPVSNVYRTARVPDEDRAWLALGASVKVLANMTLDAGYAHVFVLDSRIREVSATGDVLTGRYANHIDIISLGTRMQF